MKRTKRDARKKTMAIIAICLIVAMLVGGAYAWADYSQHKTNELKGSGRRYEVRLIEDFEEEDDWQQDQEIDKKIRVHNVGDSSKGYQEVYARIQLKEYMEIGIITYVQTAERYMTKSDGHFLTYTDEEKAKEDWPDHVVAYQEDAVTGDKGWMIQTKEKDPDGQYGKFVVLDYTVGNYNSVIPGVKRASDDAKNKHNAPINAEGAARNGECDYTIHSFQTPNDIASYVEWILNADVKYLSDYPDRESAPVGAYWLIDDTNDDGYVYWMEAIPPDDHQTTNFMEKVKLIQQPEGAFYYAIHVELEGYSVDDLPPEWPGERPGDPIAPPSLKWATNPPSPVTVRVGKTWTLDNAITLQPSGEAFYPVVPSKITWTSADPSYVDVAVGTDGKLTITGKKVTTNNIKITGETADGLIISFNVRVTNSSAYDRLKKAVKDAQDALDAIPEDEYDDYETADGKTIDELIDEIEKGQDLLDQYDDPTKEDPSDDDMDDQAEVLEKQVPLKKKNTDPKKIGITGPGPFTPPYNDEWGKNFWGKIYGNYYIGMTNGYAWKVDTPQAQKLGQVDHAYPSWLLSDILNDTTVNVNDLQVVGVGTSADYTDEFKIQLNEFDNNIRIFFMHAPTREEADSTIAGRVNIPDDEPAALITLTVKFVSDDRESDTFTLMAPYSGSQTFG